MCSRVIYFMLAALFVYVVVTVAAFVYLQWWQAILASAVTFVLCVLSTQWMIKSTFRQFGEMAKEAMSAHTKVLRGATADVHTVKFTDPPREVTDVADDPNLDPDDRSEAAADLQTRRWYEIEVTIFPDPEETRPTDYWCVHTIGLAATDRRNTSPLDEEDESDAVELYGMKVVTEGVAADPDDGNVTGPQRLRFVAGVPRQVRAVQFAYGYERFGLIRLPQALPGGPRS